MPSRRGERDFTDEIQAHLDLETDRLIAEGLSPEDARRAARRTFGNVTVARERFYESRRILWLDHLWQDLQAAARRLATYPLSCAVAVISIAGGLGATTATLVVRDAVFERPPVLYRSPERLSRVQIGSPENPIRPIGNRVPGDLFAVWRQVIDDTALAAATTTATLDVRTADREIMAPVRSVTHGFFRVLGVEPVLGHTSWEAAAGEPTGPTPAVLSFGQWQALFDGRPDVVGHVIWIANRPHVVIGVMPGRFWFSSMDSPVWTALDTRTLAPDSTLEVVVRRGPGVTPARLAEELQPGLTEYASHRPAGDRQLRLHVSALKGTPLGHSVALVLPWLLGACVLLTLLIACANVAILVIAQWTVREEEIAIRASLGASRGRIVRALVTEAVLIAVVGGLLGIGATFALQALAIRNGGPTVTLFDLSVDPVVFVESALLALLAGVLAGIGPALLETRRLHGNPMRAMRSSDRVRQRWRHALVVLETAVTVALLVVSATMLDAYRRNLTFNPGFQTRSLATVRVENSAGVPISRILDVIENVPGVAAAAASTTVPYAASGSLHRVATDAQGSQAVMAERGSIGPTFFATLDVPLRAGRALTAQDSLASPAAIVSEALAERLFPGRDPIGQRVWLGETAYDIVGVVANYSNASFQSSQRALKVYVPFAQPSTRVTRAQFLIRVSSNPPTVLNAVRRAVLLAGTGSIVTRAFTIDEIIAVSGQEILFGTAPLMPLLLTGMLLTAAGIYGVLAFAIARRAKELAVRVAIGATPRDVLRLVSAHSLRLMAGGIVCGVGATFVLARMARAAGGEGSVLDPGWPAFVVPVLIIVTIGGVATWVPSRRALRINPAVLLRSS